jgi:hypothetical protein
MPRSLPAPLQDILVLLENARALSLEHQMRTAAAEVVDACAVAAREYGLNIHPSWFQTLRRSALESNQAALAERFDQVAEQLLKQVHDS